MKICLLLVVAACCFLSDLNAQDKGAQPVKKYSVQLPKEWRKSAKNKYRVGQIIAAYVVEAEGKQACFNCNGQDYSVELIIDSIQINSENYISKDEISYHAGLNSYTEHRYEYYTYYSFSLSLNFTDKILNKVHKYLLIDTNEQFLATQKFSVMGSPMIVNGRPQLNATGYYPADPQSTINQLRGTLPLREVIDQSESRMIDWSDLATAVLTKN